MTTKNTMNETFHEESTSVDFDLKDVEGNQDLEESETPGVFAKGATRTTANKDNQKRVEHANESDRVENASVIDVLGEWATSSTINGLPHAFDREHYNRPKRSVWICLVVASFGIMIWQISVLIAEYTKYEVQTNSHIDYPTSIAFPDVTVCNSNILDTFYVNETGIMEPSNEQELIAVSQNIEEFIQFTSFKEFQQDVTTAWESVITPYGRCWLFRAETAEFTDDKIYRPGIFGGLEVILDIEQLYYEADTEAAGLRVFVTQRGSTINDQIQSFFVAPGQMSYVNVQRTTFEREQQAPWSDCEGTAPEYTQQSCRSKCFNAAYRGACGCRSIGDPSSGFDFCTAEDLGACFLLSDEEILRGCDSVKDNQACPDYLRDMHEQEICDCSQPPCEEEVYTAGVSGLALSDGFAEYLQEIYGWESEYFLANFVGLRINYDMIREAVLKESRAQTPAQFLAAIGGTMGLFAGISFISLVEIFGDLTCMRLIPRLFGYRNLYGLGTMNKSVRSGL